MGEGVNLGSEIQERFSVNQEWQSRYWRAGISGTQVGCTRLWSQDRVCHPPTWSVDFAQCHWVCSALEEACRVVSEWDEFGGFCVAGWGGSFQLSIYLGSGVGSTGIATDCSGEEVEAPSPLCSPFNCEMLPLSLFSDRRLWVT